VYSSIISNIYIFLKKKIYTLFKENTKRENTRNNRHRIHNNFTRNVRWKEALFAIYDFFDFSKTPSWSIPNLPKLQDVIYRRIEKNSIPNRRKLMQPRVFFAWKISSWAVNTPRGSRHKISIETFEKLPPSSTLLPPPSRRHPKSVS